MKKAIRVALIFGWFFATRIAYDDKGAFMSTIVGPFQSEATCKAELDAMKEEAKSMGITVQFVKCRYTQEM